MRLFLASLLLSAGVLSAQWSPVKTPNLPRTRDGKPDLRAKTPRGNDGKPDLSGLWALPNENYWHDISYGSGAEGLPLTPAGAALYREHKDNEGRDNPIARCLPASVPTIDNIPTPFKLIQNPGLIAILYEYNMEYRQIFTDGRALPSDPQTNWLGYSVGRWDGDTLVVETAGLKDNTWLDLFGYPATDALHVTERFHRVNLGSMDLEITMVDPKAYSRPWSYVQHLHLVPDSELLEWVCLEGNKVDHMVGK